MLATLYRFAVGIIRSLLSGEVRLFIPPHQNTNSQYDTFTVINGNSVENWQRYPGGWNII
jgi:hypothetical protein